MINRCSCDHQQQDALHGLGNRVMNPTKDPEIFRCTVCGKTTGVVRYTLLTKKIVKK